MRKLILIRHSRSEIDANRPANEWQLSVEGNLLCNPLSNMLAPFDPSIIICSRESKAIQTARIVSEIIGVKYEQEEDLHEHDRTNVELFTEVRFQKTIKKFFDYPEKLVFGIETAKQASKRFGQAIRGIIKKRNDPNICVVTHGTVISLFAAESNRTDSYYFWKRLQMPSFAVFTIPHLKLLEVVENVSRV